MKKYLVILINQIYIQLSYKFEFITGLISQLINLSVSIFTWLAIYQSSDALVIGGYNKDQMIFYIVLSNFSALLFSTEMVVRMGGLIRTGKLTTILLRPYNILGESLARFIGQRFIFIIIYLLLFILSDFFHSSLVYTLSVFLFFIINFFMYFLFLSTISNLGFWLIQMWPLRPLINSSFLIAGGLYFPLNLMPKSLFSVLEKTPFALVGYNYSRSLQGMLTLSELMTYIGFSALWLIFFYYVYKWSLNLGLKRYEGMGA